MNMHNSPIRPAATPAPRPADMGIPWEALPSLSHLVARSDSAAWAQTRPASLDELADLQPFHEALEGLAVREVDEPEVFAALFGKRA